MLMHKVDHAELRAHPDFNQGPTDLQSASLTTELRTHTPTNKDTINAEPHFKSTVWYSSLYARSALLTYELIFNVLIEHTNAISLHGHIGPENNMCVNISILNTSKFVV